MDTQGRTNIVTLCGSSRFKDEFETVQTRLAAEGYLVISLGIFGKIDMPEVNWEDGDFKRMLDEVHRRKIDLANRVHIINPDMYIGTSTRCEIRYAYATAKYVTFEHVMPDSHHDELMHGLCHHGEPRGTCPGIPSYDILCDHPAGYHPSRFVGFRVTCYDRSPFGAFERRDEK